MILILGLNFGFQKIDDAYMKVWRYFFRLGQVLCTGTISFLENVYLLHYLNKYSFCTIIMGTFYVHQAYKKYLHQTTTVLWFLDAFPSRFFVTYSSLSDTKTTFIKSLHSKKINMHILTNVFRRISSLGHFDRASATSIVLSPLQKVEKVSFSNYCLTNQLSSNYHHQLSSLSYLNGYESCTINNFFCNNQIRYMSKYITKSAKKRLTLTTKRAKKGFYKGNKCTNEGRITNKGRFIVNPLKRLQLIIPDLTDFKVCI